MDLVHHTPPARARRKMQKILSYGAQRSGDPPIRVVLRRGVHGPVNHYRAAHDGIAVHEAPIAAVPAAIAIIAHHKITISRNHELAMMNVAQNFFRPFRTQADFGEVASRGREIVAEGVFERCVMDHIWLRVWFAVHINALVDYTDAVTRQANHPLHIVWMVVEWKFEDDDIAAPDRAVRKKLFVPRGPTSEYKFVYEQVVPDQQGWLHGLRGNFESLNDKGGSEQGQENCDQE